MAPEEEKTKKGASKSHAKSKHEASNSAKTKSVKRKLAATTSHVDTTSGTEEKASVKKQKRSQDAPASASTLGGLLSSGLEVASNAIQAVVETVGSLTGGGDKSLLGDATTVATAIADSKETGKKGKASKKKAKRDRSNGSTVAPATDAFEGVDGTEASTTLIQNGNGVEDDTWEQDTIALRNTFDSGSEDEPSGDEGFKSGQGLPKLPSAKGLSKKLKDTKQKDSEPGAIYVGRIPHGFHEDEMREYFGQFGTVTHVRLSRNKRTGRSKHYAFVEFASTEVAKIVADTMDKYLMFGHILQCKFVPRENLHEGVWKGADKRFKTIPWAKIAGRKLELGLDREGWQKKNAVEETRRAEKAEKLKKIGYEFESPKLTDVSAVPVKQRKPIEEDEVIAQETSIGLSGTGDQTSLVISEDLMTRKTKKPETTETVPSGSNEDRGQLAMVDADKTSPGKQALVPTKGAEGNSQDGEAPAKEQRGGHHKRKPAKGTESKKPEDPATATSLQATPMDDRPAENDKEGTATTDRDTGGFSGAGPSANGAVGTLKDDSKSVEKRAKGKTEDHSKDASTADTKPATKKKSAKKQKKVKLAEVDATDDSEMKSRTSSQPGGEKAEKFQSLEASDSMRTTKAKEKATPGNTAQMVTSADPQATTTAAKPVKPAKSKALESAKAIETSPETAADTVAGITKKPKAKVAAAAATASNDTAQGISNLFEAVGEASKRAVAQKPKVRKAAQEIKDKAIEAAAASGSQAIATATNTVQAQQSKVPKISDSMDAATDAASAVASNAARKVKVPKSKAAKVAKSVVGQAGDIVASGSTAVANAMQTPQATVADEPTMKKHKAKVPKESKVTPAVSDPVDATVTEEKKSSKKATATKGEKVEKPATQKKANKKRKASTDLSAPDAVLHALSAPEESTKTTTKKKASTKTKKKAGVEDTGLETSASKKSAKTPKTAKKGKTATAEA